MRANYATVGDSADGELFLGEVNIAHFCSEARLGKKRMIWPNSHQINRLEIKRETKQFNTHNSRTQKIQYY